MHLPKKKPTDSTNFWYQWARKSEEELGLKPVAASPCPFYFRLSGTGGEIIDVWQQNGIWQGCFTKWVKEATQVKDTIIKYQFVGALFLRKYQLDSAQAAAAGRLIKSSGILALPSDENIRGWIQGLDGYEVIIQYSEKANYYLKNYWTPSVQQEVPEAVEVQDFNNRISEIINAKIVREAFVADIPFPCFTTGNGGLTCRIVDTDRYNAYWREFAEYERKIKRCNKKDASRTRPHFLHPDASR